MGHTQAPACTRLRRLAAGPGDATRDAAERSDPDHGVELRVDDRVHFSSIDESRVNEEGIVGYSVTDGERSGVYVARLPAAGRSGVGIVERTFTRLQGASSASAP